jgi:hypothetical protein
MSRIMSKKTYIADLETCPSCGTTWFDGIRKEDGARMSRLIGVYSHDRDCTIEWMCPDCKARWDRFTGKRIG